MKAEVMSTSSADSRKSRLRFLDLSFEGKEVTFKNDDQDNGRFPHGGYKGSKRHPLSPYSFDKGRDYQRQLRDDLDLELEREMVGVLGGSPTWAVEAHRWPTHSGESPLLAHRFLSPSKLEAVNGLGRLTTKESGNSIRAASSSASGVLYYRPSRAHQFLTATELRDAADCEDSLRYGRPTRTTLLRARQKVNSPSANAYELRRQCDQRAEEIKMSCAFSNPKEFVQVQSEVDGVSFYSFLTGARYNRAHCLDSKSLSQFGVYMPRHNPLGCFVVPHRVDILDTTSAPPDSPRSDADEGSSPTTEHRPTTAPGQGRKGLAPVPPAPLPPPLPPRQAWGDATTTALHLPNGDHKADNSAAPVLEEIRVWSPQLRVKGSRVALSASREGPLRFEGRLPSVHGHSLSKLRQMKENAADDNADTNQPPPTPVPTFARGDSSLPAVRPETEAEAKADVQPHNTRETKTRGETTLLPLAGSDGLVGIALAVSVTAAQEKRTKEKEGKEEEGMSEREKEEESDREEKEKGKCKEGKKEENPAEEDKEEDSEVETAEEKGKAEEEEKAEGEKEEEGVSPDLEEGGKSVDNEQEEDVETTEEFQHRTELPQKEQEENTDDDTTAQRDVTENITDKTSPAVTEPTSLEAEHMNQEDGETPPEDCAPSQTAAAASPQKVSGSDDVKFFLTEGVGVSKGGDVMTPSEAVQDQKEANDTDVDESEQGQVEPLKVVVTHEERNMGAPVLTEEDEVIAEDP